LTSGVEAVFGVGEVGVAVLEVVALAGTVPFLGSGSSNSSADKHPNFNKKPESPDRFFFLGADRLV
jgi:hypothetical protein